MMNGKLIQVILQRIKEADIVDDVTFYKIESIAVDCERSTYGVDYDNIDEFILMKDDDYFVGKSTRAVYNEYCEFRKEDNPDYVVDCERRFQWRLMEECNLIKRRISTPDGKRMWIYTRKGVM